MRPATSTGAASSDTGEQAEFRARVRAWHDRHATARTGEDRWSVPLYVDAARAREYFDRGRAWQYTLFEHGRTFPADGRSALRGPSPAHW